MQSAVNVIKTGVNKALRNRSLTNIKGTDEALVQLRGESPELNIGPNIITAVSFAVAKALAFSKSQPLYKCIHNKFNL